MEPVTYHLASIGRRFLAMLIDSAILATCSYVLFNFTLFRITILFDGIMPLILSWLYYALQDSSSYQATIGRRAMDIRLIGDEGEKIDFGRASLRYVSSILSGMILMVGYLMAVFSLRSRALHDRIARTLVVRGQTEVSTPDPTV